jgi:hypothetical protein
LLKKNKRGQSSVEYLSIVAIALMVLIPGSYLFLTYSKGTTDQVSSSQLNLAGVEIISEAEKMYVLGTNSWVTLEISLPGIFLDAGIHDGKEMFFRYSSGAGDSSVVFFPVGFNISNNSTACTGFCDLELTPGVNRVRIQSQGQFVSIRKIQ